MAISHRNMDIRIQASARELAIKYGALSLEEIVKWADGEILNNEEPNPHFYDLSLSRTMGDALSALNCFGKSENKAEVSKLAFRFFYNHITANEGYHQIIAKALYDMAMEGLIPSPEAEGAMWAFWDELDLAIDRIYGDPDNINNELIEFIKNYMG
jgi:hypothetical protein